MSTVKPLSVDVEVRQVCVAAQLKLHSRPRPFFRGGASPYGGRSRGLGGTRQLGACRLTARRTLGRRRVPAPLATAKTARLPVHACRGRASRLPSRPPRRSRLRSSFLSAPF